LTTYSAGWQQQQLRSDLSPPHSEYFFAWLAASQQRNTSNSTHFLPYIAD